MTGPVTGVARGRHGELAELLGQCHLAHQLVDSAHRGSGPRRENALGLFAIRDE